MVVPGAALSRAEVRLTYGLCFVGLERERKDAEERQALLVHSKAELEGLVAQGRDGFADYRRRIQEVLRKEEEELKDSLAALVSSLVLEETSMKMALVGINRTGLRSSVLLSSPRTDQNANGKPFLPSLIEGTIPLPGLARQLIFRRSLPGSAINCYHFRGSRRQGLLAVPAVAPDSLKPSQPTVLIQLPGGDWFICSVLPSLSLNQAARKPDASAM